MPLNVLILKSNIVSNLRPKRMPSKEHIGVFNICLFPTKWICHTFLCAFSIGYFRWVASPKSDTICILWWHRISNEKSSNFNEPLNTTTCTHIHVFAYSAIHILFVRSKLISRLSPWWTRIAYCKCLVYHSDQFKCSKLNNLKPKLLKQSTSIHKVNSIYRGLTWKCFLFPPFDFVKLENSMNLGLDGRSKMKRITKFNVSKFQSVHLNQNRSIFLNSFY